MCFENKPHPFVPISVALIGWGYYFEQLLFCLETECEAGSNYW